MTAISGISVCDPSQSETPRMLELRKAIQHVRDHAPIGSDCSPEIATGTCSLGQPIGNATFANLFLDDAVQKCSGNLHKLTASALDSHTKCHFSPDAPNPASLIFSNRICTATPPCHSQTTKSLFHWSSPFTRTIKEANLIFLAHVADTHPQNFTALADLIACHPAADGGSGLRDPMVTAIPLALISLARTLQCATAGLVTGKKRRDPVAPLHASHFQSWPSSQRRTFALCRSHGPLLGTAHNEIQQEQVNRFGNTASCTALKAA